MSGAYTVPKREPSGWEYFEPQGPAGKYTKYDNQIVVIVAMRTKKNKDDGRTVYLTRACYEALRKPEYVRLAVRGSNVGLTKSTNNTGAYKVMLSKSPNEHSKGLRFVNLMAFGKAYYIKPGVYDAHMEGDWLTFDRESKPSQV